MISRIILILGCSLLLGFEAYIIVTNQIVTWQGIMTDDEAIARFGGKVWFCDEIKDIKK